LSLTKNDDTSIANVGVRANIQRNLIHDLLNRIQMKSLATVMAEKLSVYFSRRSIMGVKLSPLSIVYICVCKNQE
jgi:hypothetical protein